LASIRPACWRNSVAPRPISRCGAG
jgi:hypothetical protein